MTESESVALPLGDTPLTNAILTDIPNFVKPFLKIFSMNLKKSFYYQYTPFREKAYQNKSPALRENQVFLIFSEKNQNSVAIRQKVWYNNIRYPVGNPLLPVAQLDSASDSDSEGRRFESFRVGQKNRQASLEACRFLLSLFFSHPS